ncbi:MAG: hypothetical protein WAQ05_24090 [Rubrivivax sp.]
MPDTTIPARRQALVDRAMARLAAIEDEHGATREGVNLLRDELLQLAQHKDLFITSEFKPAQRGTFKDFVAYRLNREDTSQRALYVSLALPGKSSPPHNHNNWAVLVGLDGVEENRLYRADPEHGFREIDRIAVGPGVGLALLGDDIHSIHVQGVGDEPVWQLRFYERALDLQTDRLQFDADGKTEFFPPNPNTKTAVADPA